MAKLETVTSVPVKKQEKPVEKPAANVWHPLEILRREVDRLFEDFNGDAWYQPFRRSMFEFQPIWRRTSALGVAPPVEITEKEKSFEISVELPGIHEKDLEVTLANGVLRIKGEKKEETEEKKKDYYVSERRYGSFERSFQIPDAVDTGAISAKFSAGVLKLTLPKTQEAQTKERKIEVRAA